MGKLLYRLCGMVLALVMVCQLLPLDVLAAERRAGPVSGGGLEQIGETELRALAEIPESRTEFTKEFAMADGLRLAAVYSGAVHYQEGGVWKEIDNTLKAEGLGKAGVYTNTAGPWSVRFPQELTEDSAVTVTKDGFTLSFRFSGRLVEVEAPIEETEPAEETVPPGEETVPPTEETTPPTEAMTLPAEGTIPPTEEAPLQEPPAPERDAPEAETQENPKPEPYTLQEASGSEAVVQSVDTSAQKAAAAHPELVLEKLTSQLLYPRVYENTNVLYNLDSNRLKESVILERYEPALLGYRYTLDTGGLTPVLSDTGHIDLYDKEQNRIVMVMPCPYLLDAAGVYCGAVEISLEENGDGSYDLIYRLPRQWLGEEARQWPVLLDPIIQADTSVTNIQDQTVTENSRWDYTAGILECGYGTNDGIERFYVQYSELPALTSADVIVNAEISLYKPYSSATTDLVEVHKVKSTWQSGTLHWSNRPDYDPAIEDYAMVGAGGYYHWNITDVVRGWYAGENTGVMFKGSDEVEKAKIGNWKQFYSSDFGLIYQPALTITFRNNNGLEAYWDYTASSAGRAGTGYVNNYTGNLVWTRGDLGFGGNRMPVGITHVYNANDSRNNDFGMGLGWRTNFNQRVYPWSANGNYYIWEDGDGTKHYFYYSASGTYKDEDGLDLTLTTTGSGASKYAIADKYGNKSYFDTYGRLTKQENNQATKSGIQVSYTTTGGLLLSTVTDGAGRVYEFRYSGSLLSRISYKAKGTAEISYVSFGYTGSQLTSVTDGDGKTARYTYTTGNLLASASDIDGYKLTYGYNTTRAGQPSRVAKISEFSGANAGGELTVSYGYNQTTFRDINGNTQILQFNNWGNTVSIQDGEGHAQYAKYAADTGTTAKGNQLTAASKLQNTVGNLLNDGSFESGKTWTNMQSVMSNSVVTGTAYVGSKSLKIVRASTGTATCVYSHPFYLYPGETCTFSAYVKTDTGKVCVGMGNETIKVTSEELPPNTDWTRMEVSYTNTSTARVTLSARVYTSQAGTSYLDCGQVELAPTASRYNLIENGDFRNGAYSWSGITSSSVISGTSAAPELGPSSCHIQGDPLSTKRVSQTIPVSGSPGDTYVLAGWAKADAAPITSYQPKPRCFALKATFKNTDGTTTEAYVNFNPYCDTTAAWQYAAEPIVAKKAYSSIQVQLVYDYNVNTVQFDGIQLYKELYGESYTYDSNGNVTSVKDLQGQTTSYEYTNNNLTKEILPTGAKLTYTYDSYHNVKTATTDTGVAYSFGYDTYGNNTSVAINSGGVSIGSTATYTSDGNRLASTKDAVGKTTTYSYNANTNVLEWVQYPEDTASTRTNYTYDTLYRLASASANVAGLSKGTALTASYTYTNDNLTALKTASTTYTFAYGNFALRSSIKIGTRTLASYTYTDRNNYLSSLDYGNGDGVDYTYDKQGRVVKETYEDGATVTYQYDNDGALATVADSATGRKTTYYYDFTDRLMKYVESGTGYSHSVGYEYDKINNLTSLVETINGVKHTTSYAYDKDNRVSSITNGGGTTQYTYDAWGRVAKQETKKGSATVLKTEITYKNPSASSTSAQVASLMVTAANYGDVNTYSYDDNGNILSATTGGFAYNTFAYDSANQLIRENNQVIFKTWVYTYDNAGNITSRTEYHQTQGTLGTPISTKTYTYADSAWGDLLTSYNGKKVTSDAIGNMLSDGTWSYTWEHGRQLASMSGNGSTWSFAYDANGLRTSRSDGTKTYSYVYTGGKLTQMTVGSDILYFDYNGNTPLSVTWNGTLYYYIVNGQGDVAAIVDGNGECIEHYNYDAWGNLLIPCETPLGNLNPLRYRSYVFDQETGLYYLQSRYYNPEMGRFICADRFAATGQGLVGSNMFAYCNNNPVLFRDDSGTRPWKQSFTMVAILDEREPEHIAKTASEQIIGLISGQGILPYSDEAVGFGTYGTTGCAVIATYNAMKLSGHSQYLSDVCEDYVWSCGTILGGLWGVGPWSMNMYLNMHDVQHTGSYSYSKLVEGISDGDVILFTVMNSPNPFDGFHTMAAQYYNGQYTVYNSKMYSNEIKVVSSLTDIYKGCVWFYGYRIPVD